MVNQTQKLNHLLDVRNEHLSVDSGKLTARLPIFGDNQLLTVDSKLAYFVCKTLCDLTKAEDDILWEIYGDIISRWSGSPAHTIQERLKDEKDWVRSFQHKKDPEDMAQMISDIRMALATLNLELVPTPLLPAFACYVSEDVEVLKQVTMMHHCSERNKNTIYILPFFPRIEKLIEASLLAPQTALTSGCDFDVAIVSTVKAIVHESRHLVGTLFYGISYVTPPMVHGSVFPSQLPEHTNEVDAKEQGEGGDWYEVSRYGAFTTPSLLSPTDPGKLETTRLALTGHVDEEAKFSQTRYLLPSVVQRLADRVRDGSFITPSAFFIYDFTAPVLGFILELDDLEIMGPATQSPAMSNQPTQRVSRHTCTARHSGPHTVSHQPLKAVDGIIDARILGYGNFRGVSRDPQ